eukprot:jgi/Tetstr1/455548/TSEL_042370.t1
MAAAALANLAQCEEVRAAITAAEGIAPLVELLTYPIEESQVAVKAAAALLNLSNGDKCRARIIDAGAIPVLRRGRGAIPVLVELLGLGPKSGPARQAAAALQELGCGTSSREAVVACGGVDALLDLFHQVSNDAELLDCCTQALVNVSRHPPARNRLREHGALEMLMRRVSSARALDEPGASGASSPASPFDGSDGLMHVPAGGGPGSSSAGSATCSAPPPPRPPPCPA